MDEATLDVRTSSESQQLQPPPGTVEVARQCEALSILPDMLQQEALPSAIVCKTKLG